MLQSTNQRLRLLDAPELRDVHIFWGYRSFIDWSLEAFYKAGELPDDIKIVIADKGFVDRWHTVFSINRQWGKLGRFVTNPRPYPVEIPQIKDPLPPGVLELGQDVDDFSYRADADDGYAYWLKQWPDRAFRPHPKVERPSRPLADELADAGLVVGLNTSALVAASLAGCPVRAYGPHSMANGINECRSERLSWLGSIEFDRADPTQVEAIAAALDDPRHASECPEGEYPPQASPRASRKKRGKKSQAPPARGKRSAKSGAGNGECAET